MAQKVTCPVCFTKMNLVGHDYVCPECGYKYCEGRAPYVYDDHNHNDYKSYNQKSTYSSGYVTTGRGQDLQGNYSQAQAGTAARYSQAQAGTAARYSQAQAGQTSAQQQVASHAAQRYQQAQGSRKPQKSKAGRLIFIIFILYFIFAIAGGLISLFDEVLDKEELGTIFENLFSENASEPEPSEKAAPVLTDLEMVSADEILLGFAKANAPESTLQELLCEATSKELRDVTMEDCEAFTDIQLLRGEDGQTYVYYALDDGTENYFVPGVKKLETSELRLFTNLVQFRAVDFSNAYFHKGDFMGLDKLICLECSNTPYQIYDYLENPDQLQYLFLNSPELQFDLTGIEKFPNLVVLGIGALGAVNVTGIGQLKDLTNLTFITTTQPSDFTFLDSLENLEYLEIETRHLMDVAFLSHMPNLNTLIIRDAISLSDYAPISSLSRLDFLSMEGCKLQEVSWITPLKNLTYVSLRDNQISDVSPLAQLPLLTNLDVTGNPVTNYGNLDRSILTGDQQ